jgi:hypothetical protein
MEATAQWPLAFARAAIPAMLAQTPRRLWTMRLSELVDRIVADGRLTRAERVELERAVCEDPELSDDERMQIQRITEMIARGDLELTEE